MITLTVNGTARTVAASTTIATLLTELNLDPARVAVERNLAVVPKDLFATTPLATDDRIEIVQFVGGG